MKTVKAYLTRRANGLYMLTYHKPVIHRIGLSNKNDAYISYGDFLGINNLCEWFVEYLFGVKDLDILDSIRVTVTGDLNDKKNRSDNSSDMVRPS